MATSINPHDNATLTSYSTNTPAELNQILKRVELAQGSWARQTFSQRGDVFVTIASLLRERSERLSMLMAKEMGKPLREGRAEIEKCASVCEYYAANAESMLADVALPTEAQYSGVCYNPLGVVLAVMPWNFPFWQVFRFAAPALMAGNAGILKHASNVNGCAVEIEQIFAEAGAGDVFAKVVIPGSRVAELIQRKEIQAVTLTGSSTAGKSVAAAAGAALKKCVLELGGSDAYVVLHDADIAHAANTCVNSRLINSGQSCIAAKRFIVVEAVYAEFIDQVQQAMESATMGDPLDENNDIGPMARIDLRDELHNQVRLSMSGGARLVAGGFVPEGPGAYYPPTVLADVKPGMPAYHEELFGPVAAIIQAKDEADAIRIANDSDFGLGAAVFSRDIHRARSIAEQHLQAGACFVNEFVRSDPRLPFGGIKNSGYGRELSFAGIREFVNMKTIYVSEPG